MLFYAKVFFGLVAVYTVLYVIFKGYSVLTHFSLQNVARLGFLSGFGTCFLLYSLLITCIRRSGINPNAVYNQSIALAMHNEKVQQFLGSHPRTGDFKAYCSTGGFKLPLVRRIRSGSYELADLLGLKPRRLQMLFVLKHPSNGREGLVSCAVQREGTGLFASTNVYTSLAISLSEPGAQEPPETIILIGKPEDVISRSFLF
ncbi:hypothetical protein STCU_00225 [Strigomonas culicis]|uniref:Uncharacterized protein n=1 Tax=Strigomonas culicis TaxID=28005 RepID=S9V1Y0_9TRYP|nr:hypothetical protein STCU_00225 [Strigomonas culicis]|eukprot:EPY37072.1 hypothetical protein STCU_00225 [Strigomonas culicis]